jgi:Hg(II)-responsive transcriptional regulator
MRIGELARQAGVGVETVRFYEREGLLNAPPRRESGYREYSAESLLRLRFIRHAKALGFSLPEIQELLALRRSKTACTDIQQLIRTKMEDVRQKIRSLKRIKNLLEELAASCVVASGAGECPVLDVLERLDDETDQPGVPPAKSEGP